MAVKSILWFRHGLRLHDNPSLLEAIRSEGQQRAEVFYPVFIFDGESAGKTEVLTLNKKIWKFDVQHFDSLKLFIKIFRR